MRTALLLLACLTITACDPPSPTAPSAPASTVTPEATSSRLLDICEAIRSGRIKPFLPVAGC